MLIQLNAGPDDAGRRLDRILRKALPDYSLSLIHRLLRQGKVLVDGKPAGKDFRIQSSSSIKVNVRRQDINMGAACIVNLPCKQVNIHPSLPEILWQGSGIIVFNKPPGLATHGPDSLDEMVRAYLEGKIPPSLSFRPGPLHRLDKPASGAVAFSETIEGARLFSRLLRERKLVKIYLAVVEGCITKDLHWQDDLSRDTHAKKTFAIVKVDLPPDEAGLPLDEVVLPGQKTQNALTDVNPLASNGEHTLAEIRIHTGRTHQIRAQAAAHGFPLAGDVKYGGRRIPGIGENDLFLHAREIGFIEDTGIFPQKITAPLPQPFQSVIKTLFGLREESTNYANKNE
jgi:23S rRNA pseudouridine955/2504/2580 synthase